MKLFQDIYIRPAGTRFDSIPADSNLLDGWDRLDLPEVQGGFILEKGLEKPLADGTDYVASESHSFSAGSYKVDATEFAYYRSTFHNVLVDIMLLDSDVPDFVEVGFGYRMQVMKVGELGDVRIMKLTAKKEYAAEADVPWRILAATGLVLITGTVTAGADGSPLSGATVTATDGTDRWDDSTDADGSYALLLPRSTAIDILVSLATYNNATASITSPAAGELVLDFKLEQK